MSSVLCWHNKDIMFLNKYFSAIQDGVSARVHAVSVCASTFLTITQASFQQMLRLTSIAWHQVRNSDREPNCLKAIGCSYSQTLLCGENLYVLCLSALDLQLPLTWNKLLYHNPLCFLPPLSALDPEGRAAVSKPHERSSLYHIYLYLYHLLFPLQKIDSCQS